jgi:hypothetical protein
MQEQKIKNQKQKEQAKGALYMAFSANHML